MATFNKVILVGNLTANPQLKYNPGGLAVANFALAVNSRISSKEQGVKEQVDFFDIVVFGKQAENCANYLSKGRTVLVEGRLATNKWEGKDGITRKKVYIVANTVQFLSPKGTGSSSESVQDETDVIDDLPLEDDIPF